MTAKELKKVFEESIEGIVIDNEARTDKEIVEFYAEVCVDIANEYKDHVLKQVGKDIKQKYIENERNGLFPIMEINETQEIISKHISNE